MRLAETDGKALLRRHGLAVPRSVLLGSDDSAAGDEAPAEATQWAGYVLKAQVLEGGRGKRGLVRRLAGLAELADTRRRSARRFRDAAPPRGTVESWTAGAVPSNGSIRRRGIGGADR